MRISDVVGGSGLSLFAQIALPIALGAFVLVLLYVLWPRKDRGRWQRLSRIPLEDGEDPGDEGGADEAPLTDQDQGREQHDKSGGGAAR